MNISDHIIDDARYIASPNHDSRPEKTSISLIIIHAISMPVGEYVTENIVKLLLMSSILTIIQILRQSQI